jgi:hypothetical protein
LKEKNWKMVAICIRCGGEDVEEENDEQTCRQCGHVAETGAVARGADREDRGWMLVDTSVNEHNYKPKQILERMAGTLALPQGATKATQAHRVMCEYEVGCRVRRAAWAVRRRLCAAVLALAAQALDVLASAEGVSGDQW